MFDTMTMTKIVGGFCGMFLIFLLGKLTADSIYSMEADGYGEYAEQAYRIDTGEDEGEAGDDAPVEEVDFASVFAVADVAEGEKLWRSCRACHKLEAGENGTGPYLTGIVGREVASAEGYSYSGNLKPVADVWSPENLDGFLADPKGYAPGTKMSYKGMPDIEDRANLIAWLAAQGN